MSRNSRLLLAAALLLAPNAGAQSLQKLSVNSAGVTGDGPSTPPTQTKDTISPDGRFVVMVSSASNFTSGDINGDQDVFVRDVATGVTRLASFGVGGAELNIGAAEGAISDDGDRLAFTSGSSNAIPGVTPVGLEIFVSVASTQSVLHASVALGGGSSNGSCTTPSISGDGRWVSFESDATNLVAGDTNGLSDVFVRDLLNGTTVVASRTASGVLGNGDSRQSALSQNGRYIAFRSDSTNLHPLATSGVIQIYVKDLQTGSLTLASRSTLGAVANQDCFSPSISGDGSRVAFTSSAGTLVPGFGSAPRAFLRDLAAGTTILLARLPDGQPANGAVSQVALSASGQFALLQSDSSNLTAGHTGSVPDVFVTQVATGRTVRASRPLVEPGEPNQTGVLWPGGVSDDGQWSSFGASSTNLMPGEPADFIVDTYRARIRLTWFQDLDGDGWGVSAVTQLGDFQPTAGWSLDSGDCDDTNAAVNPGAPEICNGIDDDCNSATVDGAHVVTYCEPGTSVLGCVPTIGASGIPSAASASGFVLHSSGLPGLRQAVAIHGFNPSSTFFAPGSSSLLCISPPRQRTSNKSTGGSAGLCDGTYTLDWLAYMASNPNALGQPLQPGQQFCLQLWYRDPGAPLNSNLTAGVSFALCP